MARSSWREGGREGGSEARAVAAAAEASPAAFEITLSLHEACRCLTPAEKEEKERGIRKVLKRGREGGRNH